MSYPRSIDEIGTEELEREIERRLEKGRLGLCDYCGQKLGSVPHCRFPDRHTYFLSEYVPPDDPVAHIPPLDSMAVLEAAHEAFDEVELQDELAREGKFGGTHVMPGGTDDGRLRVLVEEVGEVATELNETDFAGESRTKNLRKELVQVAAVAIAWVAAIDEGRPADGLPSPVDLSQTPEFATEAARRTK